MNMIIVNQNEALAFPIIPTGTYNIFMTFISETTKEIYYVDVDFIYSIKDISFVGNYNPFFLQTEGENIFYNVILYDSESGQIIYKDRAFSTSQEISTYSINEGEYTLPTIDNNNYITI